jgi:tryptophan-rich sensory protein
MNKLAIYLVFIILLVGIGVLIGYINLPGEWYQTLAKPSFTPPNWLFGPAWTILYILIGIAGARTWIGSRGSAGMRLWGLQMLLNFAWSPTFFGLQRPLPGLFIIVALLIVILCYIAERWRRDRVAALLFVPYAAWVGFATALNASIVYLN